VGQERGPQLPLVGPGVHPGLVDARPQLRVRAVEQRPGLSGADRSGLALDLESHRPRPAAVEAGPGIGAIGGEVVDQGLLVPGQTKTGRGPLVLDPDPHLLPLGAALQGVPDPWLTAGEVVQHRDLGPVHAAHQGGHPGLEASSGSVVGVGAGTAVGDGPQLVALEVELLDRLQGLRPGEARGGGQRRQGLDRGDQGAGAILQGAQRGEEGLAVHASGEQAVGIPGRCGAHGRLRARCKPGPSP